MRRQANTTDEHDLLTTMSFDNYALEKIILGILKPRDPVPFDDYIDELDIPVCKPFRAENNIAGFCIDENGLVADKPLDVFYRRFFTDQMNIIFFGEANERAPFGKDGFLEFADKSLYGYFADLYPLFADIAATEPPKLSEQEQAKLADAYVKCEFYDCLCRLILAIKDGKTKAGAEIDEYMKDFPYTTEYVNRLIAKRNGHCYLTNDDWKGSDFKLALISAFYFQSALHNHIFLQKMHRWEKSQK